MSTPIHNHKTWVEVSRGALENNIKIVRGLLAPGTKLLAVVKSNAYGHGLVEAAKLFDISESNPDRLSAGINWLGVDNIDEAVLLRENGIKTPILVMGFTPIDRFSEAIKHGLRLTIYNLFPKSPILNTYPLIHLKIDTGMSRQGVLVSDLPKFLKLLPPGLNIEGIYTHFANADNLNDQSYTKFQLANFERVLGILESHNIKPKMIHASATAGLLTMPLTQFNMVRIGAALYGLWPSIQFREKFNPPVGGLKIKPVLSWKTRVIQIKNIKKNTPIGYGISERVKKNTAIAVLPVGYYEGYDRGLSSVGEVLIGGKRCKILGRVSMNMTVADVSNIKNLKIGDEVILVGQQEKERITAEELAEKIGTIGYEIVSRINPLLPRIYI